MKLLQSVRAYTDEEVARYLVRGQYGPDDGAAGKPGYRNEKGVTPESKTETYAAARLHIDNWRWEGVPIYLRSGKALWKRGTEIIVEFKKAPEVIFRGTPVSALSANRLIFHIQPYRGSRSNSRPRSPDALESPAGAHQVCVGDAFKASAIPAMGW